MTQLHSIYPLIVIFTILVLWYQISRFPINSINNVVGKKRDEYFDGVWDFRRDANNLLLSDTQCDLAFPGLFKEIDRSVKNRKSNHVSLKEIDDIKISNGYVRGMIHNQQVSIDIIFNHPSLKTNRLYSALHHSAKWNFLLSRICNDLSTSPRHPHISRIPSKHRVHLPHRRYRASLTTMGVLSQKRRPRSLAYARLRILVMARNEDRCVPRSTTQSCCDG